MRVLVRPTAIAASAGGYAIGMGGANSSAVRGSAALIIDASLSEGFSVQVDGHQSNSANGTARANTLLESYSAFWPITFQRLPRAPTRECPNRKFRDLQIRYQ